MFAGLYMAAAALPMLAVLASRTQPAATLSELGTVFGLTAAALLYLQFLSSGRYENISGRIGIDRTMGFHSVATITVIQSAISNQC